MRNEEKIGEIITRLLRMTGAKTLEWEIDDPPKSLTEGTDIVIPLYFQAFYKDAQFSIYEERSQVYDPDLNNTYWTENVVLALFDSTHNKVVWEYRGDMRSLWDLMNAVKERAADLDGIIELLDFYEDMQDPKSP